MSQSIRGGCLCGQVAFQVCGPFDEFHLCHCSQCRRSTGSAHASNLFTRPERIEWLTGAELVKRYIPERAGVISKSFCSHCGSLLPYISLTSGKLVIPAGSLSESPGINPQDNIFWQDRADWYDSGLTARRYQQGPEE